MIKIGVIDYGVGNIGSVLNMLKHVGAEKIYSVTTPDQIEGIDKLILPGVGSFDHGMKRLIESGFDSAIKNLDSDLTEILGICLGMQLLTEGSEEGILPGLGLIPGRVKKFSSIFTHGYPVPHMGWNRLEEFFDDNLFSGLTEKNRFYFVHSYYYPLENKEFVTSISNYEEPFGSSIRNGNVSGVQFHPEKSHSFGKQILRNFIKND